MIGHFQVCVWTMYRLSGFHVLHTDEDRVINPSIEMPFKKKFFFKCFPSVLKQDKEFLTQLFQTS